MARGAIPAVVHRRAGTRLVAGHAARSGGAGTVAGIREDANGFLRSLVDTEARGAPITLPDGTKAARLPGYFKWLWDGEFCGSIGLRWQPGTEDLPPHCLGHIG